MKFSLLPKSLASRTILILLIGFALVQALGLAIETYNQISLQRIEEEQAFATRAVIIYRHIALAAPADRPAVAAREPLPHGDTISLDPSPPDPVESFQLPLPARQIIRASIAAYGIPPEIRPRGLQLRGLLNPTRAIISFALPADNSTPAKTVLPPDTGETPAAGPPPPPPNGFPPPPPVHPTLPQLATPGADAPKLPGADAPKLPSADAPKLWLNITTEVPTPAPWHSPGFATSFLIVTLLGAIMIYWAVRQLLVPVRTLANAAEQLGRDVGNAPALPETGPTEIVTAAIAFNTMAGRIRRFVDDRTFLITAIGHDLRTPITRLKLRAEYMDDDEQRTKMLADLDEMEAMVSATLAFGRDITTSEPLTRIDLAVLLRTILDEAADGEPERGEHISYSGLEHLAIKARPLALKRAFTNLISNALKYGDAARVKLSRGPKDQIWADIEDDGPGIETAQMDTVFEPFRRLETSRNRETGGSGLGLSIARNIIRAHGGDILLSNLSGGGLRARVTLPL